MLNDSITGIVGNTPLVKLSRLSKKTGCELYLKMESMNPMGSVKDRLGLALIQDTEHKGLADAGTLFVEATSGNTGIALAFICANRGYKLALTMPESMSIERRQVLIALGAQLHLTPAQEGMPGAVRMADEIAKNTKGAIRLGQFDNPANPNFHESTTGPEIFNDLGSCPSVFVAGVGTGGTFTGVTRYLKKMGKVHAVAVEPKESPVMSGGKPGPHRIQGIGAGFLPEVMDLNLVDEIITVDADEAALQSRRLAKEEGIFLGISAGANVTAAVKIAERKDFQGSNIVTIACDIGDRYLSTWLYTD